MSEKVQERAKMFKQIYYDTLIMCMSNGMVKSFFFFSLEVTVCVNVYSDENGRELDHINLTGLNHNQTEHHKSIYYKM